MDIYAPLFTLAELTQVAGIDRGLASVWLKRGLIKPARFEQLSLRRRALFSMVAIFEARLVKIFLEKIVGGVGASSQVSEIFQRTSVPGHPAAKDLARASHLVADEGWMWAVARSQERGQPLPILAAVSRRDADGWHIFLEMDANKFADRFQPETPYVIIPVGAIFAATYVKCKALYAAAEPTQPRKRKRARP